MTTRCERPPTTSKTSGAVLPSSSAPQVDQRPARGADERRLTSIVPGMLVGKWLRGIGLDYAVPTFEAAGIVTAQALSELDPSSHFEALGVTSPDDRRKLFFLVQRVRQAQKATTEKGRGATSADAGGDEGATTAPARGQAHHRDATTTTTATTTARAAQEPSTTTTTTARASSSSSKLVKTRAGGAAGSGASSSSSARTTRASSSRGRQEQQQEGRPRARHDGAPTASTSGNNSSNNNNNLSRNPDGSFADREEPSRRSADAAPRDEASSPRIAPSVASHGEDGRSSEAANGATTSAGPPRRRPSLPSTSRRLSGVPLPTKRRTSGGPVGAESSSSGTDRAAQQPQPQPQPQRISARTGKALSSIPSQSAAPMSPLVSISLQDDDGDPNAARQKTRARGSEQVTMRTARRASNLRIVSRADVDPSAGDSKPSLSRSRSPNGDGAALARAQRSLQEGRGGSGSATESPFPPILSSNPFASQIERLRERNAPTGSALTQSFRIDPGQRVSVVVRKRPASHDVDMLQVVPPHRLLVYQPRTRVDLRREIATTPFRFDGVVDEATSNATVYENVVQPLLPKLAKGQNATVFCFGQTNSGKTHTLLGSTAAPPPSPLSRCDEDPERGCEPPPPSARAFTEPGLYYLAAVDVFDMLSEMDDVTVTVSLLELYDRKVLDLLNGRASVPCWEDGSGKVQFPGLSLHRVASAKQLQRLVEQGHSLRSIGTTSKNNESSRSHAVLQLHINRARKGTESRYATMTFIDLAGSERGADTALFSSTTRLEGAEINTSLLALKEVLRAMSSSESTHVPYRGSKLTQILKESLVGASSTCVMIACVCPNMSHCEPTLNTLRYANCLKEFEKSNSGSRPRAGPKQMEVGRIQPPPLQNSQKSPSPVTVSSHPSSATPSPSLPSRTNSAISEVSTDASAVLDDILSSPGEVDGLSPENESSHDLQRMAAQSLLNSHKESMTAMLAMAKDEMTQVCNHTGESLEATLQYMEEAQNIQARQLAIISNLREALLRYYEACESRQRRDERFEDLRD